MRVSATSSTGQAGAPRMDEVWKVLSGLTWRTLALAPVDAGTSTADAAAALADAARRLDGAPVTFMVLASPMAADAEQLVRQPDERAFALAKGGASKARTVVSVPPILSDPRAASVLKEAEAVVIFARLGESPIRDIQRLVRLVGRERVVGCVVVG